MRKRLTSFALGGLVSMLALAAMGAPAHALDPYDAPIVTCEGSGLYEITLKICGGVNTGAPAGITIQYKKVSDFEISGWADDGTLCKMSLSGQPSWQHPGKSRWELLAGECETVMIGDVNFDETGVSGNECSVSPLECGTDYVFRVFAHAGRRMGRSDWTANVYCSTSPCDNGAGCTFTQGYWKNHGPGLCLGGNNDNEWPVASLTLGTVNYNAAQLCAIFDESAKGNGLISLAHQLIAAKFNVLNGADDACVTAAIAAADVLIGNKVVPPVGGGFIAPGASSALNNTLNNYNQGNLGCAAHCPSLLNRGAQSDAQLPGVKTTWGNLKTIYR